jgi:hypothetical protein
MAACLIRGHLTWWKISYTVEVVLCNIRPDKVPLKFSRKYQTGLYDRVKIHIIGSCKIITAQNNNVAMLQMMGCRSNSTPGLFKMEEEPMMVLHKMVNTLPHREWKKLTEHHRCYTVSCATSENLTSD